MSEAPSTAAARTAASRVAASPVGASRAPAKRRFVLPRWTVYLAGFVPAAWVFYLAFADRLGADPVRMLEHTLGIWALRFLVGGLAISPLRQLAGVNLLRYRRAIGLLAFFYAALHVGVYLLLDQGLDWTAIWADILKRWYITFGFFGFVSLVPLAVTSNNASVRRLGGKAWAKLHRLVYAAAILGVLHFIYVMKVWAAEPLIYAGILLALLLWRLVRSFRPRTARTA